MSILTTPGNNLPVRTGLLNRLKKSISNIVHSIPSIIPIWLPSPKESNIRKNIIDQNGAGVSFRMAWVKTMKARPVPSAACQRDTRTVLLGFTSFRLGWIFHVAIVVLASQERTRFPKRISDSS